MSRLIHKTFPTSLFRLRPENVHRLNYRKITFSVRSLSSYKPIELKYPNGKVLLTKTSKSPTENHVTIDELLDKDNLRKLMLATYQLEADWFISKLPHNIPICLVRNWHRQSGEKPGTSSLHSKFTVIQPPLPEDRYGSMHAKLMILYYDEFLRVVVTSANVTSLDWENFENAIFVQDFHRAQYKMQHVPAFGKDLYHFLGALKVPNFIRNSLTSYDFSTAGVSLIPSVPGCHPNDQEESYGHKRVAQTLKAHGLMSNCSDNTMKLEYQTSALGAIDEYWLREFYRSCGGGLAAKGVYDLKELPIEIIYPSQSTIDKSIHGHNHQFHLKESFYSRDNFPKKLLRDSVSKQPGVLSHSKVFLAKLQKSIPMDVGGHAIGWSYLGSHNLSGGGWYGITFLLACAVAFINIAFVNIAFINPCYF
ncbi:hypothetical protein K7432_015042 [Basidiobolus ranarum]|uniref:Phospholipase D/nuclease n=1 Tax=Basidiobolus ranarum TaxID=34480 RepID=A0ABR2VNN9_9FUNG